MCPGRKAGQETATSINFLRPDQPLIDGVCSPPSTPWEWWRFSATTGVLGLIRDRLSRDGLI